MGCTASRKKTRKRRRRKKPADTQSCAIRTTHLMLWNIREAFHYFAVSPPHSLFGDKTYFLFTRKVRLLVLLLLLLLLQALAVKHFCDDGGWRLTTIKDQSAISICWPLGPQAYICQEQHISGTQLAARRIINETCFQKPSWEGSPLSHVLKISFFAQKRPAENSIIEVRRKESGR